MEKQVTILLLALLFLSLVNSTLAIGYTDVTVSEAKTMVDSNPSLVVLDVRSQSEYDSGHIRNAKLIPHTQLEGRLDELNITDEILVYCLSGGRSSIASQILVDNGFLHVYNMLGGITAWKNAGYTVYIKYSSIQQAINNANEGDTLYVSSGTYHEHIVVGKTLSLVGESRYSTTIDGEGTANCVMIYSADVVFRGFTVKNGHFVGVRVYENVSGVLIKENVVLDSDWGIYLGGCLNTTVEENLVKHCLDGIFLESSSYNLVIRNTVLDNNNGIILITAPTYPELPPPPPSSFNTVYHNNFINNTHQAHDYGFGNTWNNGCEGNYWSNYNGTDLDGDGIGDEYLPWEDVDNYPLMSPYIEGDVNHDGIVELMDFFIVSIAFGSTPLDPNWNPHADLNADGIIELMDFWIISENFGKFWWIYP